MKTKLLSTLSLLLVFSVMFADPIDKNTAKQVGLNFLNSRTSISDKVTELILVYSVNNQQNTESYFYIFNFQDKAYIIVSGDDHVSPILGYSNEGNFNTENISPQVSKWLENYKSQISYVIENNITATDKITAEWDELLNPSKEKSSQKTVLSQSVSPLIQTNWSQSPYVNDQCPYDENENQLTVTGCVATAMAQIMKYWSYPSQGFGFHSYNHTTYGTLSANFGATTYEWASMPNNVNSPNEAVATLMYHSGVSVNMNYGTGATGGSGAAGAVLVAPALSDYFGYASSTIESRSDYTDSQWINILKQELNASRPMYYEGAGSSAGHAFVCDGYDNNDFFHMNWGWGGLHDGYFNINALNPSGIGTGGGSGSYNFNQKIVRNIQPTNAPENFDLTMYSDLSVSQSNYWFGDQISVTAEIQNNGSGAFSGEFAAAVFNSQGQFVEFLSSPQSSNLSTGFYTTLTFNNDGGAPFIPGEYSVSVFYRLNGGSWVIVANEVGIIFDEINFAEFDVNYSSDIETYSDFSIATNDGILYQGQSTTINVNVTNTSNNTFIGDLRVNLSNLDGSFAQNIQIITESNGLPTDYSYTNGLNFTGNISVQPGTYLMEVAYKPQGTSSWFYAGSTNYQNPIFVTVEAPPFNPDPYENNNDVINSFTLSPSFSGDVASVTTTGSNLHVGNDNDFYRLSLPEGFDYTLSARLQDSYDSNNGNAYSVDALFSYSTDDGMTWSNVYDTTLMNDINISNGGDVIFHVANYFEGNMGTYLLDVDLSRETLSSQDFDIENRIKVYPNPANEFVNINLSDYLNEVNKIEIINVQGKIFSSIKINNESLVKIPLYNLSNGVYFARIESTNGISTKKIIVSK